MMKQRPTRRLVPPSEQGYIILIAVFLMALMVISLAIAAPQVAKSIQRDRDLETWHCGMQYRRAIQLYYRKFHAYPPNADALKETNNIRFLRKQYVDPITNKPDWKPVLFGQNKVPVALGFFGEPLAGGTTTIAGVGPSGGNGIGGSGGSLPGGISDIFGGSSTSGSSTDSSSTGGAGTSGGPSDGTGGGTSGSTSSTGTTTPGVTSAGGPGSSTSSNQNGQTFGGAGIIGFSPVSPKKSILVYKKKDHYNEWEFTYDPISDQKVMTGGNVGSSGLPTSNTSTPGGSSPFGNPTSGPTNSSPTSSPTTPQQQ